MRPLWFVAGVGAGAYVVLRARNVAEALTPEGLHDRMAGLRLGWELFSEEVRSGMTEKEAELRATLLDAPDGPARLPAAAPPAAPLAHPDPIDVRRGEPTDGHQ